MIREPLWDVDACRVDADLPRTANTRAWDVPETALRAQLRVLAARQRKQSAGLADRSAERLQTVLAPNDTTPEPTPEEAS